MSVFDISGVMKVVKLEWAAAAAATRGDLHGVGEVTAISSDDISLCHLLKIMKWETGKRNYSTGL
jgi:hypothetical protein